MNLVGLWRIKNNGVKTEEVKYIDLPKGSIFLTSGTAWLSRWIAFFSKHGNESETVATHVGLVTEKGLINQSGFLFGEAMEALKCIIRWPLINRRVDERFIVFRPVNIGRKDLNDIVNYAKTREGRKYGYKAILFHALDGILGKIFGKDVLYFRKKFIKSWDAKVCSSFVGTIFGKFGYTFGTRRGHFLTPDDIWDFCVENPDKWEFVGYAARNRGRGHRVCLIANGNQS